MKYIGKDAAIQTLAYDKDGFCYQEMFSSVRTFSAV
jgi:hypothetical protein